MVHTSGPIKCANCFEKAATTATLTTTIEFIIHSNNANSSRKLYLKVEDLKPTDRTNKQKSCIQSGESLANCLLVIAERTSAKRFSNILKHIYLKHPCEIATT